MLGGALLVLMLAGPAAAQSQTTKQTCGSLSIPPGSAEGTCNTGAAVFCAASDCVACGGDPAALSLHVPLVGADGGGGGGGGEA